MIRRLLPLIVFVLLGGLLFAGIRLAQTRDPNEIPSPLLGKPVPAFALPAWVRDVSLALPTTWAMRGLEAVTWQRGGLLAALPSAAAVATFALVLLAVASLRLRMSERAARQGRA